MEIKIQNLYYGNIFKKLNLQFTSSEINAIMGKANSGKSLLFELIFGSNFNYKGKIIVGDKTITKKELGKIREQISYVRQEYESQLYKKTIRKDIKNCSSKIDLEKLNELLKSFGLSEEILDKTYVDLSSGEIKKVLLIKAFIKKSSIILLDDPTLGLDSKGILSLVKILKREKRNGKLILLTSPNSDFLIRVATKIYIIDKKKQYSGDKYKLFSDVDLLNKNNLTMPEISAFKNKVLEQKNVELINRDNINDLIKDIYRIAR